jgi:hypothetical protein
MSIAGLVSMRLAGAAEIFRRAREICFVEQCCAAIVMAIFGADCKVNDEAPDVGDFYLAVDGDLFVYLGFEAVVADGFGELFARAA